MKLAVVIPAAGASSRMGTNKLLLPWCDGKSIIENLIHTWIKAGAAQVMVVMREEDTVLAAELARIGHGDCVINQQPENGMISSIIAASQSNVVISDATHVAIALGDQPQIGAFLTSLLDHVKKFPQSICQPRVGGKAGHPVILPVARFSALPQLMPLTLKSFLSEIHDRSFLELNDLAQILDMDYPADYIRLRQLTISPCKSS